jgi:uncharacterized protein (DUF58 family)
VYAGLSDLLHCRLLAKDLTLSRQRKILNSQAGLHTSRFRGRGIDFSEVRAYQSGDDMRSIDWRVTARTGKPHTKLYTEERERPTLIILDQSHSMFFGSQQAFKSVRAAQAAALLGWAALARGDRVGGIIFSDQEQGEIRPRRNHRNILHLIDRIIFFNHALGKAEVKSTTSISQNRLSESLNHARRTTKPGSELFIISDFLSFNDDCRQHLFKLSRHNDVVCINSYDTLERDLPKPGLYTVTDGHQKTTFDLLDQKTRSLYHELFEHRIDQLRTELEQMKIPLVQMANDQPPLQALQAGLGIRGRYR